MADLKRRLESGEWLDPGDYVARNRPGKTVEYELTAKEKVS
jgi:hypothetical protein